MELTRRAPEAGENRTPSPAIFLKQGHRGTDSAL